MRMFLLNFFILFHLSYAPRNLTSKYSSKIYIANNNFSSAHHRLLFSCSFYFFSFSSSPSLPLSTSLPFYCWWIHRYIVCMHTMFMIVSFYMTYELRVLFMLKVACLEDSKNTFLVVSNEKRHQLFQPTSTEELSFEIATDLLCNWDYLLLPRV